MNKKKLFTSLLCFSMLALAACGGDKGKEGQTSTSGETSEPAHVHTFSDAWSKNNSEHWHTATCGHQVEKDRASHTPNAIGFCSVCGFYEGDLLTLNTNNEVTIEKGKSVFYRAERSGNDTDYGVYTDFNDPDGEHIKIEAYILASGAPVKLQTIENLEAKVVRINQTADDNYIYLVYSYSGENNSATVETSSLNTILHGYDQQRNYYGNVEDLVDSSLTLTNEHLLKGEYCVGFNPSDSPEDYCYEITVTGTHNGWQVLQSTNTTVSVVDTDENGYFLPVNAEPLVINIWNGSNVTVQVTEHARA